MKKVLVLLIASFLLVACTSKVENKKRTVGNSKIAEQESDDLYSFQFKLAGKVYSIPCSYSKIKNDGWQIADDTKTQKLQSLQYTVGTELKKDNRSILVEFINFTAQEMDINKCSIGGIVISATNNKQETDFMLPKGIKLGSLKEEVISAYGEATNKIEYEDTTEFQYLVDKNIEIILTVNNDDQRVTDIKVENLSNDIFKGDTVSRKSKDKPKDMPKYTVPTELSQDILSFNIKLEDALYHIPAPIDEFIKNGWVIQKAIKNTVKPKEKVINGLILRKGNITFTSDVYNPSKKETDLKNCYVVSIKVDEQSGKVNVVLPGDIGLGSTSEEIQNNYAGKPCLIEDSVSYTIYEYQNKINQFVYIVIDKESDLVTKIRLENSL